MQKAPYISRIQYRIKSRTPGILDILYPIRCFQCHHPVQYTLLPICMTCVSYLERANLPEIRTHIARHPHAIETLEHIYAHWMFDKTGTVQLLHQALKYQNRPAYGHALGQRIGRGLQGIIPLDTIPHAIVPIPLHAKRYFERGYNQSYMLASGISETTRIPIENRALVRNLHTSTQTGLGQGDRWKNVASAFKITAPQAINGRHILLVDDVLTTGATLLSAAHTLMGAGAYAVSLATLAFARL